MNIYPRQSIFTVCVTFLVGVAILSAGFEDGRAVFAGQGKGGEIIPKASPSPWAKISRTPAIQTSRRECHKEERNKTFFERNDRETSQGEELDRTGHAA